MDVRYRACCGARAGGGLRRLRLVPQLRLTRPAARGLLMAAMKPKALLQPSIKLKAATTTGRSRRAAADYDWSLNSA